MKRTAIRDKVETKVTSVYLPNYCHFNRINDELSSKDQTSSLQEPFHGRINPVQEGDYTYVPFEVINNNNN